MRHARILSKLQVMQAFIIMQINGRMLLPQVRQVRHPA